MFPTVTWRIHLFSALKGKNETHETLCAAGIPADLLGFRVVGFRWVTVGYGGLAIIGCMPTASG